MASESKDARLVKTQQVCIDLPGESVKCWRSDDNLKVVLRKHRDVIFDLKLGGGQIYTVESTCTDFYNANVKKLVSAKRRETVTFNDGERLHLWVTRSFKGELLLKCGDRMMLKIEPAEIDRHQYDDDPKTKPAPIIVALGQAPHAFPASAHKENVGRLNVGQQPGLTAAPIDAQCSVVCVVEGTLEKAPGHVIDFFKKGGGKSGMVELDPNEIATRNWILGQVAAGGAYAADNWKWLRASIDGTTHEGLKLVKAKVHLVRGKVRFYFSGYSKINSVFGPGGFSSAHERVIEIFAGAGTKSSAFTATTKGLLGSVKGNAVVAFIFSSATAIAEWKDDLSKDGYDLTASLLMALLKSMLVAALTAVIVAGIVALVMIVGGVSVPIIAVGTATIIVGLGLGYAVDALDKRLGRAVTGDKDSEGLSAAVAPALRGLELRVEENWIFLMKKFFTDYQEMPF
jgi:hypothetical protein